MKQFVIAILFGGMVSHYGHATPLSDPLRDIGTYAAIYPIRGVHSVYGTYTGELEVRPGADGRITVNRLVTFNQYRFEGFQVQEVWSGQGQIKDGNFSVLFTLKQADLFNIVDSNQHSAQQFQQNTVLPYTPVSAENSLTLQVANGNYVEKIAGAAVSAGADPLWMDQRQLISSFGDHSSVLGPVAMATLFAPFMSTFQKDPTVASYMAKPECNNRNNFIIQDQTDFAFLRANPNMIRVDNKVTDTISLVEASLKRDAYAPTLAQKQSIFDQDIPQHHLNSLGQYSAATYDTDGNFNGFSPDGDAALYTGMYVASQAMRYLVTGDPQALANFKTATTGLMLLLDVTGISTEFARTAQSLPATGVDSGWVQGVAPYQNVEYMPGGNNDMIKGIFLAFSMAYEILPAHDPFLAQVSTHAQRLTGLAISNQLGSENFLLAHGLAALATGSVAELLKYTANYRLIVRPSDFFALNLGFFYGGIADWSGSNLLVVSKIARVSIAKNLVNSFNSLDTLGRAQNALAGSRQSLMDSWAVYRGSKRDAITVAAATFGLQGSLPNMPSGYAPKSWDNQSEFDDSLAQTVWSLNEVPIPRSMHAISLDFSMKPDWCMSYWPQAIWQSFGSKNPIRYFYQGAYAFPFYEADFLNTDDFNKDGFTYKATGNLRALQQGRVDFLFLYWMSRLGQVTSPTS